MRILLSFCLLRGIVPWARADVRRKGKAWGLEDSQLRVTVGAENAHLTVLDKASDTLWQQEDPAKGAANKDDVRARSAAKPIVVDGTVVKGSGGQVELNNERRNTDVRRKTDNQTSYVEGCGSRRVGRTSGNAATDPKRCGDSQSDRRASPREVEVP